MHTGRRQHSKLTFHNCVDPQRQSELQRGNPDATALTYDTRGKEPMSGDCSSPQQGLKSDRSKECRKESDQ